MRERAIKRKLIEVGTGIADTALNPMGKDVGQLLDEAESRVFEIAEAGARGHQGLVEIQPILAQVMERIDMLYHRDNPSDITGIATGFNDLDQKTSGLQQGDLIIVAGRPSMGKTAFALNIAEHVAVNDRLPVAVFSMEMAGSQLAMRMLGSIGAAGPEEAAHRAAHRRGLEPADRRRGQAARRADPHRRDAGIERPRTARARAAHAPPVRRARPDRGRLPAADVDRRQASENRATEISEISRSLKALAKELDVPVVALSQLNRGLEQRPTSARSCPTCANPAPSSRTPT